MPVPLRLITCNSDAASITASGTGSTPASQPTQPGSRPISSWALGSFPGVQVTTSKPASVSRSNAGWPPAVNERGVMRIRGICLFPFMPCRATGNVERWPNRLRPSSPDA